MYYKAILQEIPEIKFWVEEFENGEPYSHSCYSYANDQGCGTYIVRESEKEAIEGMKYNILEKIGKKQKEIKNLESLLSIVV